MLLFENANKKVGFFGLELIGLQASKVRPRFRDEPAGA